MVGSIVETSPAPGITGPAAAKTIQSIISYREQGAAIQVGLPKMAQVASLALVGHGTF